MDTMSVNLLSFSTKGKTKIQTMRCNHVKMLIYQTSVLIYAKVWTFSFELHGMWLYVSL